MGFHLPLAVACQGTLPLAVIRPSDLGVLVVLVLFTWWGAHRGVLRQVLSLGVLLAALFAASRLGPGFESTAGKLSGLTGGARAAAAWGAALFLGLVAGALLLRLLIIRLPEGSSRPLSRWLGGILGFAKGSLVVLVGGYALLAMAPTSVSSESAPPSLSRPDALPGAPAPRRTLPDRVRGSVAAGLLVGGAAFVERWVDVPVWIQDQVGRVNQGLDSPAPRRPSDG